MVNDKVSTGENDTISTGETVSAVLKNVNTGEKRVVTTKRYKVEITITDLRTGKVTKYEEER